MPGYGTASHKDHSCRRIPVTEKSDSPLRLPKKHGLHCLGRPMPANLFSLFSLSSFSSSDLGDISVYDLRSRCMACQNTSQCLHGLQAGLARRWVRTQTSANCFLPSKNTFPFQYRNTPARMDNSDRYVLPGTHEPAHEGAAHPLL